MILVINTCKEKLHYFEFVKPIEEILKSAGFEFFTRPYLKLQKGDLMNAQKVIICGTSLKDNDFVKDINYFLFIKDILSGKNKQKLLGICAGMQVLGMVQDLNNQVKDLDVKSNFNHILKNKTEIGFFKEKFKKEFLGLKGEQEVYHLHNNYISKWKEFDVYCEGSGIPQAVRHKDREIYGCLFHPEVRQKELIVNFARL